MKDKLIKRIKVAGKQIQPDLIIRNAKIVNVFTGEIMEEDIAIADHYIAGIGKYSGSNVIDAKGKFVIPGLIDGHVHIESSMLTPQEFAKVSLLHGVTTVVTDPHEIANVAGVEGIQYMLEKSEGLPLDIKVMLPSCVPAVPKDSNGANLYSEDLEGFYNHERVLGLAEVMDYPSVYHTTPDMMNKLLSAKQHNRLIDGHAAGIEREKLNVYAAADIRNDHEATTIQEAKDRLDLGMYLMIREGTVAKDLKALLPIVTERNARRCLFVTDDKLINDLVEEGSVDHCIRLAIKEGLDPITAIQMATINSAECYKLDDIGAIAPGYKADFLFVENLEEFSVHSVFKNGDWIVKDRKLLLEKMVIHDYKDSRIPLINSAELEIEDLLVPLQSNFCHLIEIIPNSIVTNSTIESVNLENGYFVPSVEKDQLKLIVVERHHQTGNIGKAIVKGFGIQRGAIATTISHDSHNIVSVGTNDKDILLAIKRLKEIEGGIVVVAEGEIIAQLSLPIAGLISDQSYLTLYEEMKELNERVKRLKGSLEFNPFLTLSFLSLTVIPTLKLTDKGLFNFASFSYIGIEAT
ncbi:adenine deaminase [Bacillus sp. B1-b2]|uniref:adenine deaminase n=1 Tax=Bacillus sp. B1-b2 TaxID=2653201 RepID=UPI0012625F94|nr:adenine deaminase [Bacillus sp. B1-b2]KAB7666447.1 adenine deaminase [Bacillus sp. B1-b2]